MKHKYDPYYEVEEDNLNYPEFRRSNKSKVNKPARKLKTKRKQSNYERGSRKSPEWD